MLFIFCLDSVNNYITVSIQSKFNYSTSSVNFIKCVYTKKQEPPHNGGSCFFYKILYLYGLPLCVFLFRFLLRVSVIVDCVGNGDDDQQPDEEADRSGKEYAKASV